MTHKSFFFSSGEFGNLYICYKFYIVSIDIGVLLYYYGLLLGYWRMVMYVVDIVCFTIVLFVVYCIAMV